MKKVLNTPMCTMLNMKITAIDLTIILRLIFFRPQLFKTNDVVS